MSILDNAIASIQLGVEDFQLIKDDPKRVYSSMRNLFSGTLLLFKHKLCLLSPKDSPDLFIKQHIKPRFNIDGQIFWESKNKNTVDVQAIKERFKDLNISVNWQIFDSANKIRNNIEHYFDNTKPYAIRAILSNLFIVIRDFITDELSQSPQVLLGDECWNILQQEAHIYLKNKEICQESLKTLSFFHNDVVKEIMVRNIRCPICDSEFILPNELNTNAHDTTYKCQSCTEEHRYEEIVNYVINDYFSAETHSAFRHGGEPPLTFCPGCGLEAYFSTEGICLACGHQAEHECPLCSNATDVLDDVCSYCQYKLDNY